MACGVFAPCFILLLCLLSFRFSLFLCVCPAFVLLSFVGLVAFRFPLFVLLSCVFFPALSLYFLFPLRTIRKERAQRFCPLCPLLFCYVCLDACIVIKEFRCRCFGFFQFVGFVLPCNAARIGRLAGSYFDFLWHNVDITNNCSAFLK